MLHDTKYPLPPRGRRNGDGMQNDIVAGWALYAGFAFLWYAIESARSQRYASKETASASLDRLQRADDARERRPAEARLVVSATGFAMAVAIFFHVVSAAIGYSIISLALATRCIWDQVAEETAPRRRSTILGRHRAVDTVLLVWLALSAASMLVLVPLIGSESTRPSAIGVAVCGALMVGVAWRIASAPPLLSGDDLEAEQAVDNETRAIRTGNTCLMSVGVAAFFAAYAGAREPFLFAFTAWIVLFAWKLLYARQLTRIRLT